MADYQFSCPLCREIISCDVRHLGSQINCPTCRQTIVAPPIPTAVAPPGERVIQIRVSTLRKTALVGLCLLLAVGVVAGAIHFFGWSRAMTFKGYVDGTDVVKLRGGNVWVEHQSWELPKTMTVNGRKWDPPWSGNTSGEYKLGGGFHQRNAASIKLTKLNGRGPVTIMDMPTPDNHETLSIKMDDGDFGGADWYEFVVSW